MLGLILHKKVNKDHSSKTPVIINADNNFHFEPDRPQLVAHWVKDDHNQLICQWVYE